MRYVSETENLNPLLKILTFYILLVTVITLLPGKVPYEMVIEGGPVETLSAGGYFLFCLFIFYFNIIGSIRTGFAPGFFVFLLGLRELDFHARFTTMGMFKSRFFISPEVPIMEKSIVTIFIIGLVIYAVIYFRRSWPGFKRALSAGKPWAVSVACAVGCVVLSKILDGNSKLFGVLSPLVSDTKTLAITAEECLELLIPIFFIRALLQYSWDSVKGRLIDVKSSGDRD